MSYPDGPGSSWCDPMPMLNEAQPVIGITEWEDKQCEDFKEVPEGSIVLVRDGKKALALCKIVGPNYTSEKLQAKYRNINYRNVEILRFIPDEDQPPHPKLFRGTFRCCKPNPDAPQWSYIHRLYTDIMMNKQSTDVLDAYVQLLKEKKNIILQGAPGVGKTYSTASLAVRLCNPDFIELGDHVKVMEEYERLREAGQIAFCTFHQSMDYEDFVEGLKPELQGNQVVYNVEAGIFRQVCEQAQATEGIDIIACIDDYLQKIRGYENRREVPTITGKSKLLVWWQEGNRTISTRSVRAISHNTEQYSPSPLNIDKVKAQAIGEGMENNWPAYASAFIKAVKKEYQIDEVTPTKPHILIIDEINRGNISRIFGELITLLEADKRRGGELIPSRLSSLIQRKTFRCQLISISWVR